MNNDEAAADRIALYDLDGTLADYDTAMRAQMDRLRAPEEPEVYARYITGTEPPHLKARRVLIQNVPGFWRSLKPLEVGFDIVQAAGRIGFKPHVLTKGPGSSPGAWGEKLQWVQEFVPNADLTISQDKSLVYGRVLVDDYPPYFLSWLAVRPRGLVICVAQPWNKDIRHPNLLRYDGSNKDAMTAALQHAFDRRSREP